MAKLRQVGNSLVVTIPAALAKQYGLKPGDDVEIEPDGDALRLVPMVRVPRARVDGDGDHEAGARELLRRYHAELDEALARAERQQAGAARPGGAGPGRAEVVEGQVAAPGVAGRAGRGEPREGGAGWP